MKANYKDALNNKPEGTSEVTLGNVYDMNKQLMDQVPALDNRELGIHEDNLQHWFFNKIEQKYFMLLCHEQRDYTIFNLDGEHNACTSYAVKCKTAAYDVIDCMRNRGTITSIHLQEDGAYELWIRNEEGSFAYYLFPYGAAVLEY